MGHESFDIPSVPRIFLDVVDADNLLFDLGFLYGCKGRYQDYDKNIANKYSTTKDVVWYLRKKLGIPTYNTTKRVECICDVCGVEFIRLKSDIKNKKNLF